MWARVFQRESLPLEQSGHWQRAGHSGTGPNTVETLWEENPNGAQQGKSVQMEGMVQTRVRGADRAELSKCPTRKTTGLCPGVRELAKLHRKTYFPEDES